MYLSGMNTVRYLLTLFVLFFAATGFAQFRKYSNEFLNIGAGARGLAMGGAQVASVNDNTAGYWNPAGLAYQNKFPSLGFMHASYFAGIGKYDFLTASLPSKNGNRVFGITALRFGVDDIPNTLFLVEPDGSVNYNNITTFSSSDYAFLLSYAQKWKEKENSSLSFGGNVKIIYRKVGSFANAIGFGFDGGLMYKKDNWQLGVAARDVTTTFNAWSFNFTDAEKEKLYLTNNDIPVKSTELTAPQLLLGGAYKFWPKNKLNLLAEMNLAMSFDGKANTIVSSDFINIDPKIGLEAAYNNLLFVRAGISNFQRALADGDTLNQKKTWIFQPAIGAGFKIGNVALDYAFSNLANQSNPLYSHIFSIRVDFVKRKENN